MQHILYLAAALQAPLQHRRREEMLEVLTGPTPPER